MPITVALGFEDRHFAIRIDAQKAVRVGDRLQRINGDLKATIGTIFEPNRRRQATGHLSVCLRLGCSCPDGRPADQILKVLRCDGIKRFRCSRQPDS